MRWRAHYWDAGIRHIVALRGDMPGGEAVHAASWRLSPTPPIWWPGCGASAISKSRWRRLSRDPSGGGEPEADLDNLKRKLDAGATRAITQYFFDAGDVSCASWTAAWPPGSPRRSCRASCRSPISPRRRSSPPPAARASRPGSARLFEGLDDDPETRRMVAAVVAAEQVRAAAGQRRGRVPLLHAEPAGTCLCDRAYPRGAAARHG